MDQKVFISNNKTATFVCPKCGNVTTTDVARYAAIDQKVTVKCRCNCGNNFKVILEKRQQFRKSTDLPGTYFHRMKNGEIGQGSMRVIDISGNGLKIKLSVPQKFSVGEIIKVQFRLDDKHRTQIEKEVIVRNVNKEMVGTSFSPTENDDANLGFYLMS
jgi:hypothetical protein